MNRRQFIQGLVAVPFAGAAFSVPAKDARSTQPPLQEASYRGVTFGVEKGCPLDEWATGVGVSRMYGESDEHFRLRVLTVVMGRPR